MAEKNNTDNRQAVNYQFEIRLQLCPRHFAEVERVTTDTGAVQRTNMWCHVIGCNELPKFEMTALMQLDMR